MCVRVWVHVCGNSVQGEQVNAKCLAAVYQLSVLGPKSNYRFIPLCVFLRACACVLLQGEREEVLKGSCVLCLKPL